MVVQRYTLKFETPSNAVKSLSNLMVAFVEKSNLLFVARGLGDDFPDEIPDCVAFGERRVGGHEL